MNSNPQALCARGECRQCRLQVQHLNLPLEVGLGPTADPKVGTSNGGFVRVPLIQFQAPNGWYGKCELDVTKTLEKLRSTQIQSKKSSTTRTNMNSVAWIKACLFPRIPPLVHDKPDRAVVACARPILTFMGMTTNPGVDVVGFDVLP